jgi:hypothetical protein
MTNNKITHKNVKITKKKNTKKIEYNKNNIIFKNNTIDKTNKILPIYHNGTNNKVHKCINKYKIIPIKSKIQIIFSDFNDTFNIHHILTKEILYIWNITKGNSNIIIVLINYYNNSNTNKWRLSLFKLLFKNIYVLSEDFSYSLNTLFINFLKNKYIDKNKYTLHNDDPYNRTILALRNRERFIFLHKYRDTLISEYNTKFNNNIKASINNIEFINIHYFLLDYIICKINYKELDFINKVKNNLNLKISNKNLKVGFIYRNNDRILYDYEIKKKYNKNILVNTILNKECKKLNIPFKIANFDNSTFEEQAEFLKDIKILICCHGAALTNMFLLPKDSTIFEISFRKYYYCNPVCENHYHGIIPYTQDCHHRSIEINGKLFDKKTKTIIYIKGDYHNLAELFNLKYQEIFINDVSDYLPYKNPVTIKNIYIDTKFVLNKIKKIY